MLGDTVKYWAARKTGPGIFSWENSPLFNTKYLEQTHTFYVRHRGMTIIMARFIAVIRTFAPLCGGHRLHALHEIFLL